MLIADWICVAMLMPAAIGALLVLAVIAAHFATEAHTALNATRTRLVRSLRAARMSRAARRFDEKSHVGRITLAKLGENPRGTPVAL